MKTKLLHYVALICCIIWWIIFFDNPYLGIGIFFTILLLAIIIVDNMK
ncbi:MAG: hypothetical protein ABII94_02625 [Patescibacteria group bacterium]